MSIILRILDAVACFMKGNPSDLRFHFVDFDFVVMRVLLVCLGSREREAAVQLWNSEKTFYTTSYPSKCPS